MIYLFSSTPQTIEEYFKQKSIDYTLVTKELLDEFVENYSPKSDDLGIVYDFGAFIPKDFLEKLLLLNIHFSLLPKYRGATPVEAAILTGDTETGIAIQKMVEKMDEGPLLISREIDINDKWNSGELQSYMDSILPRMLRELLEKPASEMEFIEQVGEPSYCYMKLLNRENAELQPLELTSEEFVNKVRAFNPEPLAWIKIQGKGGNSTMNVYKAELYSGEIQGDLQFLKKRGLGLRTKDGVVLITKLVVAGQKLLEGGNIVALKGRVEIL